MMSLSIVGSFNDVRIKIFKSKFLNLYDARNQALKKVEGHYTSFWIQMICGKKIYYKNNRIFRETFKLYDGLFKFLYFREKK